VSHFAQRCPRGSLELTWSRSGNDWDLDSHTSESSFYFGKYTRTTKSTFSGSSIFDKSDPIFIKEDVTFDKTDAKVQEVSETKGYINPGARLRRQDSLSSVRSSLATNAPKSGQRRVPPTPDECRNGDEFDCFVCQEKIKDIQSREAWK
jgi:hypothetical protein